VVWNALPRPAADVFFIAGCSLRQQDVGNNRKPDILSCPPTCILSITKLGRFAPDSDGCKVKLMPHHSDLHMI
jgi:hypothetical protein